MIRYIKQTDRVAKIYLDSNVIGHISNLSVLYEVSVCYHDFTLERSLRRFIKPMIETVYETTQYLLEADRLGLPIRINQSLDLIPDGKKNLTILA